MKLVGERRALAAIVFALYFMLFMMNALLGGGPTAKAFYALAGVYGLAFLAVVAGYFWGRWYAVGVSLFGVITAGVGLWQMGPEPVLLFFGGTHLTATLMLWGNSMSQLYDGQLAWREKFHMDESAVQRLGRSVIRAGVSLPFVLLYSLMPKPGSAGAIAAVLAVLGFAALVRLRTWGVLALGAAGALTLPFVAGTSIQMPGTGFAVPSVVACVALVAAAAPFVAPIARFVTGRRTAV